MLWPLSHLNMVSADPIQDFLNLKCHVLGGTLETADEATGISIKEICSIFPLKPREPSDKFTEKPELVRVDFRRISEPARNIIRKR